MLPTTLLATARLTTANSHVQLLQLGQGWAFQVRNLHFAASRSASAAASSAFALWILGKASCRWPRKCPIQRAQPMPSSHQVAKISQSLSSHRVLAMPTEPPTSQGNWASPAPLWPLRCFPPPPPLQVSPPTVPTDSGRWREPRRTGPTAARKWTAEHQRGGLPRRMAWSLDRNLGRNHPKRPRWHGPHRWFGPERLWSSATPSGPTWKLQLGHNPFGCPKPGKTMGRAAPTNPAWQLASQGCPWMVAPKWWHWFYNALPGSYGLSPSELSDIIWSGTAGFWIPSRKGIPSPHSSCCKLLGGSSMRNFMIIRVHTTYRVHLDTMLCNVIFVKQRATWIVRMRCVVCFSGGSEEAFRCWAELRMQADKSSVPIFKIRNFQASI